MRNIFLCLCVFTSISLIGCGGDDGPARSGGITGEVALDGTPVAEGEIVFLPEAGTKGPPAYGKITAGKYSFPGDKQPVIGDHSVQITWAKPTGESDEQGHPVKMEAIPERYNKQTELKAKVAAGKQVIDFKSLTVN